MFKTEDLRFTVTEETIDTGDCRLTMAILHVPSKITVRDTGWNVSHYRMTRNLLEKLERKVG